jgi:murein DD-endopeptidase MepM/ murein hydrolase activator NlpD
LLHLFRWTGLALFALMLVVLCFASALKGVSAQPKKSAALVSPLRGLVRGLGAPPTPPAPVVESPMSYALTAQGLPTQAQNADETLASATGVLVPELRFSSRFPAQGQAIRVVLEHPLKDANTALPFSQEGLVMLAGKQRYPLYPFNETKVRGLLPVDPLQTPSPISIKVVNAQGQLLAQDSITVKPAGFKKQWIVVSKKTSGLEPEAGELEAIQRLKDMESPQRLWGDAFVAPVPECMNSPFGVQRYYNGKFSGNYHKGVDQRSPLGRTIKAVAAAKVQIARPYQLHGGTVGLDHGQGLTSVYIHMSKILVKPGQVVQQGEAIGLVGSTGFASGPHLHWGLYVHGVPINPMAGWVTLSPCS